MSHLWQSRGQFCTQSHSARSGVFSENKSHNKQVHPCKWPLQMVQEELCGYESLGLSICCYSRITEQFGMQRTLKFIWFQPPAMGTFHQTRLLNVSSHLSLHLVRKSHFNYSFRYDGLRFSWLLWKKTLQFLICFCLHFTATISRRAETSALWRNPCMAVNLTTWLCKPNIFWVQKLCTFLPRLFRAI